MNKLMSDYFWTKEQDSAYLKDFTDESVYLEMPLVIWYTVCSIWQVKVSLLQKWVIRLQLL